MKKETHLAYLDHLTGIYNRRYFEITLKKLTNVSKRNFSLLMIDIDKFKKVNDQFGHHIGDKVLHDIGRIFKKSLRKKDLCFRYGGDEIVMLLPNTDKSVAGRIATRLKQKIERHKFVVPDRRKISLGLSIGLAVFPEDGKRPMQLIKKADEWLYKSKKRPKPKRLGTLILKTKLIPPSLKPNLLIRRRLLLLIKQHLMKKSILIIADAGYGKTTLLTQLIKANNPPCVFYNLDRSDSDIAVFFSYLVKGIERVQVNLARRTKGLLRQGGETVSNLELLMGTLINELMKKRKEGLFLVLDDYHNLVKGSLVHKALDYFISRMPKAVHVIIASRSEPALPSLARWRSKQDLFELGREDLRFTEAESKMLLTHIYKMSLTRPELSEVDRHTEGWITGIQLILQSAMRSKRDVREILSDYLGSHRPIFEYFANEILVNEPAPIRDFLRFSSILHDLTPDACDEILGLENSSLLLEKLAKRNMFLFRTGENRYRYHHLFQQFLRSRVRDEKKKLKHLHKKAGDYYRKRREYPLAIEHYLNGEYFTQAGRLIGRIADEMMLQARASTIRTWLNQLPESVFEKLPLLSVLRGYICLEEGLLDEAEAIFISVESSLMRKRRSKYEATVLAESLLEHGVLLWRKGMFPDALSLLKKADRVAPPSEKKMRGHILNLIGLSWDKIGKTGRGLIYLKKAHDLMKSLKEPYGRYLIESNIGTFLAAEGKIRESFDIYRALIPRIGDNYYHGVGIVFYNATRSALDFGDLAWAESCLKRGWELCRDYEDIQSRAGLHAGSGHLNIAMGKLEEAKKSFTNALEIISNLGWVEPVRLLLLDLCHVSRYQDDYEGHERYLRRIEELKRSADPDYQTELAFYELFNGRKEKAVRMIRKCLNRARASGNKQSLFGTLLNSAQIYQSLGKKKIAQDHFQQAVKLSMANHYDGILIRNIRYRQLLKGIVQNVVSRKQNHLSNYLRNILKQLGQFIPEMRIQLLGKFDLLVNGISLTHLLKRRTTKAILAYFLLHPKRSFTWEEITSWVWPESASDTAHQMFKVALWEIRRCSSALKSVIRYDRGRYSLNPEQHLWVDVCEFEKLLKQALVRTEVEEKEKLLERADNLYQGPLLSDLYYTWVQDHRNALERLFAEGLASLAKGCAETKDYEKSISYCSRSLKIDNLNEDIHRLLLRSYISLGQKAKALKHYEKLRKIFRKNLNSEPSAETGSLIKSLL